MLIIGLTGSIAMGKSTVARLFQEGGLPVISADQIVHDLYENAAVANEIEALFKGSTANGRVDRAALMQRLDGKAENFKKLEALIHPLVRAEEWAFIKTQKQSGTPLIIIEIPLLFETGAEQLMDKVVLASASAADQKSRALSRPGMTEEKLAIILAKQMPDEEKRQKADIIINTSLSLEETAREVKAAITSLTALAKETADESPAYKSWQAEMQG